MSIYDIEVKPIDSKPTILKNYEGKVLVIVNTATKCGLAGQFKELEELYQTYKDRGLVVLGFPSNQFKQELSSGDEASTACRTTYGVTFPMHEIEPVNGPDANPLFSYLKSHSKGFLGEAIKWNFTKFLVSRDSQEIIRYAPTQNPEKMIPDIERLLARREH